VCRYAEPIVDMSGKGELSGGGGREAADGAQGGGRRLEQEPLLAARIMIEDGMCLLLDVVGAVQAASSCWGCTS
jgi:DNA topoisomerase 2-associated protein PAT1